MKTLRFLGLLLMILFGLLAGCKSTPESTGVADIPADLAIVFGEGGGFTGMWTGHTVAADGTVSKWHGKVAEENPEPVGRLSPDQRAALWARLIEADFVSIQSTEVGNLTRFIKVVAAGKTHEVSWIPPGGDSTGVPAQLQELLGFCRGLVPTEK
ncbi:MAG: hypothetical protein ABIF77_16435 [bacterium]